MFAGCSKDYVGTSFSLAFPPGLSATASLTLHITTNNEDYILVTADVPNQSDRRLYEAYVRRRTPQVSLSHPPTRLSSSSHSPSPARRPPFMFVVLPRTYPIFAESSAIVYNCTCLRLSTSKPMHNCSSLQKRNLSRQFRAHIHHDVAQM